MSGTNEGAFDALRGQLEEAAATFADGPDALKDILLGIVDDVDRAVREPLEIFPVCHHSPASAIAMARRLREKRPKVVYLELCEDMALLTELRNCTLPVAVQSFAAEIEGFPAEWAPLSVVAPITEASAEYQAIAYTLDTPGTELVLVDRSSDHVFQWEPRGTKSAEPADPDARRPTRRARCTATPSAWRSVTCARASPNWRSTCCATAGCGTGRNGGTSTSNCRSATATTTPTGR